MTFSSIIVKEEQEFTTKFLKIILRLKMDEEIWKINIGLVH